MTWLRTCVTSDPSHACCAAVASRSTVVGCCARGETPYTVGMTLIEEMAGGLDEYLKEKE